MSGEMGDKKMKMIIDVDTGIDDAQAIMMAVSRQDVDVIGITCVSGNVGIDQVCVNTLRVLKFCNRLDIPVFKGAASPFIVEGSLSQARYHHGNDGLGDVPDISPVPPGPSLLQSQGAVQALLELTNQHPGEITLVALAPLTNIALAVKLDAGFGRRLKHMVIMGGNIEGRGNVSSACAEFNFFSDPEGAYITLRELGCPISLVAWETCLHNALSWDWFDQWKTTDTPKARFNFCIIKNGVNRIRNVLKILRYRSCDPVAMAVAVDSSLVLESETMFCTVELQGKVTRGQMVVDWQNSMGGIPNVTVVTKIDLERFAKLMETMLL
ncbi:nucleoside hydrolase-like [Liolophura sinensis]|uniref:nucleoside hydrolase-like n=1 Tax=Liolophura sinensis TaxID=3198878 RepID=UPI003159020F